MLRAEEIECTLGGRPALSGVSVGIGRGDVVGVIGPNGAGKSTLLRALGGLLRPSAGRVLLEGRDILTIPERERARRLAYVSQNPQMGFGFRVSDVVSMGRYSHRSRFSPLKAEDREAMRDAMEQTGVTKLQNRRVTELSGGERQRVFLARALAQQPSLLLLDEPIANLDVRFQLDILDLVKGLNDARGLTVVVAIHDLTWALRYCKSILALKDGRLIAQGPAPFTLTEALVQEVFRVPARVVVAAGEPARVDIGR